MTNLTHKKANTYFLAIKNLFIKIKFTFLFLFSADFDTSAKNIPHI